MPADLDTRIGNYGDQLDRRAASLETLSQRAVSTTRPLPVPRRRWALVTGAAAVLLVAVGGVAVLTGLFGGGGGVPVATVPETPAITFQDGTWQVTELEASFFVDVEATSFGLVATANLDGIWISENGRDWDRVFVGPHEPSSGTTTAPAPPMTTYPQSGDTETWVQQVAEYDGDLYAASISVKGANSPETTERLIVYRSVDGVTWEETMVLEADGAAGAVEEIADLVATDAGLIIYVEWDDYDNPAVQSGTGVYRSADGLSWTLVDPALTGLGEAGLMYGVTPYSGGFIAVADLPAPDEGSLLGVYRSADGISWEPIPDVTFGRDNYSALHPDTIVEHDGVLFLGGFEEVWETGTEGALWRSNDGMSFERLDLATDFSLVHNVLSTPYGLLVVGWSWETGSEPARLVLLTSTDGSTFLPVDDGAGILDSVRQPAERVGVVFGDSVILFGLGVDETGEAVHLQWAWTPTE